MTFMNIFKTGSVAKKAMEWTFGVGASTTMNYKLGEAGIEGIAVSAIDIASGLVVLSLEGETRQINVLIDELVYKDIEFALCITSLKLSIMNDGTGVHKVWLESLVNIAITQYIKDNSGLWINNHVKKIRTALSTARYSIKIEG